MLLEHGLPGSPPLVRERRDVVESAKQQIRITPARAGKTRCSRICETADQDHPRSCGKDKRLKAKHSTSSGSPPLVRERQIKMFFDARYRRITPARAGKTSPPKNCIRTVWDHPRSCGKDYILSHLKRVVGGSPPLVRERLFAQWYILDWRRITPARAGKTLSKLTPDRQKEDHPRSCGKDHFNQDAVIGFAGSPPLVRERRHINPVIYFQAGITPARAGKTCKWFKRIQERWDHPRSCGKDGKTDVDNYVKSGSPPLVRERLMINVYSSFIHRITPARAGKTHDLSSSVPNREDHPRSCGKD